MVLFTCDRCLFEFNKKSTYVNHTNRKIKCKIREQPKPVDNDINAISLNIVLDELKKIKESCAILTENNKTLTKRLDTIELQNTNDNVDNKNVNNGTINKHVNNGTINNIHIVAFGKENMNFVIDDIGKLCQGNKTVSNLINYMHFNESKPENHNVYMPNRKNKSEVFVHNGTKWILADKKAVVEQLIDKGIEYVEGKLEELGTIISQSKYNAVERAIDIYNDTEHEQHNETTKKITKDIELILYNNKDLILSSKTK
jgi:hypothetical protein